MNIIKSLPLHLAGRAYEVAALAVATALAPLSYVAVPLATLLLFLYFLLRARSITAMIPLSLGLAVVIPLLYSPLVGIWASAAFALPEVGMLNGALKKSAETCVFVSPATGRRPTRLLVTLWLCLAAIAIVAVALRSWGLLLSDAVLVTYLGTLTIVAFLSASRPVAATAVPSQRVLSGESSAWPVKLNRRSNVRGQLLFSSRQPWLRIRPMRLALEAPLAEIEVSVVAPPAGAYVAAATASYLDPWGLVRSDSQVDLLDLFVIPRARYAEWLAKKYLEASQTGGHEAMSSAKASQRASRGGVEFYGVRQYQSGDSMRAIDWKHSLKLGEMIVKEMQTTDVSCAILLVNLSASDEEQKDRLAWGFITATLTLARENIPSVIGAYDEREVVSVTDLLDPRQALVKALALAQLVRVVPAPLRFREVPDLSRLRWNILRLGEAPEGPAGKLADLLRFEYKALVGAAAGNPASKAMTSVRAMAKRKANVLVLSGYNHDAVALATVTHMLSRVGYPVLRIDLNGKGASSGHPRGGR